VVFYSACQSLESYKKPTSKILGKKQRETRKSNYNLRKKLFPVVLNNWFFIFDRMLDSFTSKEYYEINFA